jgi:hypothetical protein
MVIYACLVERQLKVWFVSTLYAIKHSVLRYIETV